MITRSTIVPLLLFLAQGARIALAQNSTFYYACFPPSFTDLNTLSTGCPSTSDAVTVVAQVFWSKCICAQMLDQTTDSAFTYCTSTAPPPDPNDVTFTSLCSGDKLQASNEDTCSSQSDLDTIAHTACSGASTAAQVLSALCSDKNPIGLVVTVLTRFKIGGVVLQLLGVACKLNPTFATVPVNAICGGIDALQGSCTNSKTATASNAAVSTFSNPTGFVLVWIPLLVSILLRI
ncbi:hypothetical protein BDN72DRAFT_835918 [Pluteus cervinus]|uniref:Uncharacterized protein n=1 Tax=Pluteus cervinus TaxID=181527 RepID=A0ACD3B4M4_9AGAR|nr:hypothetical protein BDN72DRAFT_835918 [Pluteus cervinus]